MSLDIESLEKVKRRTDRVIARCPACAEIGQDKKGEHLLIDNQGHFACVVYPGAIGKQHRKRIYELVGKRSKISINRHQTSMRVNKVNHGPAKVIVKDVLGRLGRQKSNLIVVNNDSKANRLEINCKTGVPDVPKREERQDLEGKKSNPIALKPMKECASLKNYSMARWWLPKNGNFE